MKEFDIDNIVGTVPSPAEYDRILVRIKRRVKLMRMTMGVLHLGAAAFFVVSKNFSAVAWVGLAYWFFWDSQYWLIRSFEEFVVGAKNSIAHIEFMKEVQEKLR